MLIQMMYCYSLSFHVQRKLLSNAEYIFLFIFVYDFYLKYYCAVYKTLSYSILNK